MQFDADELASLDDYPSAVTDVTCHCLNIQLSRLASVFLGLIVELSYDNVAQFWRICTISYYYRMPWKLWSSGDNM